MSSHSLDVSNAGAQEEQASVAKDNLNALNKLRFLARQKQEDERVNTHLLKLIQQAEKLEPSSVLNEQLNMTYSMLIGALSPEKYMEKARELQGEPSLGWKVLGGLMMTLGILMAASGAFFIGLAIATLDPIVGLGGVALLEGAFLSTSSGYDFFSLGRKSASYQNMEAFYNLKRNLDGYKEANCTDADEPSEGYHHIGI
jgi:hypothetical protein